jgi:YHS domain-containing protein
MEGLTMAIDPVCGMEVDESSAAAVSEYKGVRYYFCAVGCKQEFDRDPEKFIGRMDQPREDMGH